MTTTTTTTTTTKPVAAMRIGFQWTCGVCGEANHNQPTAWSEGELAFSAESRERAARRAAEKGCKPYYVTWPDFVVCWSCRAEHAADYDPVPDGLLASDEAGNAVIVEAKP